jgi:hypothetical protein
MAMSLNRSVNPVEALAQMEKDIAGGVTPDKKMKEAYQANLRQTADELRDLALFHFKNLTKLEVGTSDARKAPDDHSDLANSASNLSNFVTNDILEKADIAKRTLAYERWIGIMKISLETGDLHTVAAIKAGLSVHAITRLEKTFAGLSPQALSVKTSIDGMPIGSESSSEQLSVYQSVEDRRGASCRHYSFSWCF